MTQRNFKSEVTPEQMIEQLRQLVAVHETARPTPPRYEPIIDEPAPWSVPPPGGFAELRAQLRKAG